MSNHESWFRRMEMKLVAKSVWYVIERTKYEHAWINNPKGTNTGTSSTSTSTPITDKSTVGIEGLTSSFERLGGTWNTEKAEDYRKDNASALFMMFEGLTQTDEDLYEEYDTAGKLWAYLKEVKYGQRQDLEAMEYMTKILNYQFSQQQGIRASWEELQSHRRKLISADATKKGSYPDDFLYQILTLQLVKNDKYTVTVDALNFDTSRVEDKVRKLAQVEANKGLFKPVSEAAHAAYQKPPRRNSGEPKTGCHLCDKKHWIRDCPYLGICQEIVKSIEEKKTAKTQKQARRAVRDAMDVDSTPTVKKHFSKFSSKDKDKKKSTAFPIDADTDDDNSSIDSEPEVDEQVTNEVAQAAKVLVSKKIIPSSSWASDTGASSHMSDQRNLFSSLKRTPRRTISVGGGFLYSEHRGSVKVVCKDGTAMILKNVLFVPNLGINLLSGRRLCEAGLRGSFSANSMQFLSGDQPVITAEMTNGLYIVSHVHDRSKEMAFPIMTRESDSDNQEGISGSNKRRYELWHRRFSHLNHSKLKDLHLVTTLDKAIVIPKHHERDVCEVCSLTKLKNKTNKQLSKHATRKLELIQCDVAGPFLTTIRGNSYFLLIIDSFTRMNWVIPLSSKSAATQELETWKKTQELQTGEKVTRARSDNAPELLKSIRGWQVEQGTLPESTTPATSRQNGPAERNIQTAEADARALLQEALLPAEFWDEAIEYDAYLRNCTATGPTLDENPTSPFQAYTGEKPSLENVKVFGSKCYMYIEKKTIPANQRHDKLMNTGRAGIYMGLSPYTDKHFRVYCPELGYTTRASRVVVDEKTRGGTLDLRLRGGMPQGHPNWFEDRRPVGRPRQEPQATRVVEPVPETHRTTTPQVIIPEFTPPPNVPSFTDAELEESDKKSPVETDTTDLPLAEEVPLPQTTPLEQTSIEQPRESMEVDEPILESREREEPVLTETRVTRASIKRPILDPDENPRLTKIMRAMASSELYQSDIRALLATTHDQAFISRDGTVEHAHPANPLEYAMPSEEVNGIPIPLTHKEAVDHPIYGPRWRQAMREELITLGENGTFKSVKRPQGVNVISTKWVYTIKTDSRGNVERFKARLVARGFSQSYGADYTDTFAPTVRMDTLRIFFAMVAKEDLACIHIDIKNAFTESKLKEELYMDAPKGMPVAKGNVLRLLRSLYGLKQAARDWNLLLKRKLLTMGFVQSLAEPCLFTNLTTGVKLLVYVDDIAAAAKNQSSLDSFYKTLCSHFRAKNLGAIEKILGMRVTRDRKNRTLYLDQEEYLRTVLTREGYEKTQRKPRATPCSDHTMLRPATDTDERVERTPYQRTIGSLMYAMVLTRPDICTVLGKLAQFMSDPAVIHHIQLQEMLRYIDTTIMTKIRFGPGGDDRLTILARKYDFESRFVIFTDSDWANDKSDRKSISGSVAIFYGGTVSWYSKKQRSVSTSSCEAEYIALATAAKQTQWMAQVFRDLGGAKYIGHPTRVQMFGDNQGALALLDNPQLHERSKHIDIQYHYIRELREQGKLIATFVPTKDMAADGMTKVLTSEMHRGFREMIGLVEG
jgi:hypothetical protein